MFNITSTSAANSVPLVNLDLQDPVVSPLDHEAHVFPFPRSTTPPDHHHHPTAGSFITQQTLPPPAVRVVVDRQPQPQPPPFPFDHPWGSYPYTQFYHEPAAAAISSSDLSNLLASHNPNNIPSINNELDHQYGSVPAAFRLPAYQYQSNYYMNAPIFPHTTIHHPIFPSNFSQSLAPPAAPAPALQPKISTTTTIGSRILSRTNPSLLFDHKNPNHSAAGYKYPGSIGRLHQYNSFLHAVPSTSMKQKNRYICEKCDVYFRTAQALGGHMSYHSKANKEKERLAEIKRSSSNASSLSGVPRQVMDEGDASSLHL